MKFIYRTLAILTLAMAAGLTHSYFMPLVISFGGDEPRQVRDRPPPRQPVDGSGLQGQGAAEADPAGDETGAADESSQPVAVEPEVIESPDPATPPTPEPTPAPGEPIDIYNLGDFIDVPEARAIWREAHEEFLIITAFLDARFADQYAQGHITTARRLMPHEITDGTGSDTLGWLLEQNPDLIVIYCEGGECDASKNLARQLQLSGFAREQLHVLQPGYPAWAAQHPDLVTTGDEPGEP